MIYGINAIMKFLRRKEDFNPDDPDSVIAACKRNDPKAQRALIRLFYGYVKSISLRYSGNDQDAEEILNDSFLKVFSNLDRYDESQAFKGWLRSIAVNTAIDAYRKNARKPDYQDIEYVQAVDISEDVISSISAEEILNMVRRLSPAYRTVFTLFVIDGYTHREIAEKLGVTEGTSKSNLQDARKRLQSIILRSNTIYNNAYELKTLPAHEN